MKPIKRVEIVTDSLELKRVLHILDELGVSGYTVIREVTGKGERGTRAGDELTDVFKNSYVMTACGEDDVGRIAEAIRPVLQRTGGVCLVSDAQWIVH
ncbi:MAG TPA: P-II family nitrogen regulator [Thermoanaerobaculia bacterium]|nr:P-II family nitrogen regulator [Thermoanaerobaculia bacterium]